MIPISTKCSALFHSTSSLVSQCITRLTLGPVQAQVNLPSSFLLSWPSLASCWMLSVGILFVAQWERAPQSQAGINTELTGVTGNSDLGILHDFGSASIQISLSASDASELFPWVWSLELWRKGLCVHLNDLKYGIRKWELLTVALQNSLGLLWKHVWIPLLQCEW